MRSDLSVIYDMTKNCPWNCAICCMGATPDRDRCGDELTLGEKMQVVENLAEANQIRKVRVDFSGGEIFTDPDNVRVVEYAAKLLGRENVGISTSGYRLDDAMAKRLSGCISDCEMTMDTVPGTRYPLRPDGYASAAAKAVPFLKKYGITTGIQTVLAHSNCNAGNLQALYEWLCLHEVDAWSILRFYPSGRGAAYPEERIGKEEEAWAVGFITEMGKANGSVGKPKIDFHYTMKGHGKYSEECRCVKKSIGVMPDGEVTACFWAVDAETGIIDSKYRLGNLKEERLTDMLRGGKAAYWLDCHHTCGLGAA